MGSAWFGFQWAATDLLCKALVDSFLANGESESAAAVLQQVNVTPRFKASKADVVRFRLVFAFDLFK